MEGWEEKLKAKAQCDIIPSKAKAQRPEQL
jgi:hypothetical protein